MMANRITRPEARVLAEEEFTPLRGPGRVAHAGGVGDAHRLHRLGRPQDGAARPRLGRSPGVSPRVRPPVATRHAAQQGDRLAPLGRRHERAADSRARPPLERRARRPGRCGGPEGGQGPVAHAASGPLHPPPVRAAHRMGTAQVPARRRVHPRRLGPPHRHPRGHRPPDAAHGRSRRPPCRRHRRRVGRHPRPTLRARARRPRRREVQPGRRRRARRDRRPRLHPHPLRPPARRGGLSHPLPCRSQSRLLNPP